MTKETLQSLIDRVIGSKGILRVPAWWVRKLFSELLGYADTAMESAKEYTDTAMESAKEHADTAVSDIRAEINESIIANEEVIAAALNDLNSRIKALEDK